MTNRYYTAGAIRSAAQKTPVPRPATVERVSPGVYVVTGVAADDGPMLKPTRQMRIRHEAGEPWRLIVGEEQHSMYRTLRQARYAASAVEFGVQP